MEEITQKCGQSMSVVEYWMKRVFSVSTEIFNMTNTHLHTVEILMSISYYSQWHCDEFVQKSPPEEAETDIVQNPFINESSSSIYL